MNNVQEQMIIRKATRADARQIAEIVVEDWKNAYRGIIDDDYLDSMSVEEKKTVLDAIKELKENKAVGKENYAALLKAIMGML